MQPELERERDLAWERALIERLDTRIIGHPLLAFNQVGSTNDVAKQMAANAAPDGLTIIARHQTNGRGRRGRKWLSAPGQAVLLSILLRPPIRIDQTSLLGVLGGIAVADALAALGAPALSVKWPNDILVRGKKIAGILVEPRLGEGQVAFAVIGVGLNVAQRESDWPEELQTVATSCALEGCAATIDDAAVEVLRRMDAWYLLQLDKGPAALMEAWSRWTGSDRLPTLD